MPVVVALGELLTDWVSPISGATLIETPAFQQVPGGIHIAAGLAELGMAAGLKGWR